MKNYALAGLVAAQLIVAAQPAAAASFDEMASVQTGTFAGARMRLSLGGGQQERKLRAGLTLAPMLRSQAISGESRMRFGEGVELGFAGKRPLTLSLSGRPVSRLTGTKTPDGERNHTREGQQNALHDAASTRLGTATQTPASWLHASWFYVISVSRERYAPRVKNSVTGEPRWHKALT